ncbi:MAG: PspA/IM30 family protein [Oscillospiraceae bacterium]|nr:PspA/IM30 family protein [Oscillospiraceae bacterium]
MGILSRFTDLMKANVNTALEKAESKNADVLLEQYIRDAQNNLEQVKAETAGVIADETAAGRRVSALGEEIDKLAKYAEQAVLAGNDDDAKKFLEGKTAAESKKADAETAYAQAQVNSDRMRQLTKKLSGDIAEANGKLSELKGKLDVAKQTEKMNELTEKISSMAGGVTEYDQLADAVQKRIDAVDAKAQLNQELNDNYDINKLKEKYETQTAAAATGASLDDELAALKAKLGK